MSTLKLADGRTLKNVHLKGTCLLAHCAVHNPSKHPLDSAPFDWLGGHIAHLQRVCEHGYRHPDPDDLKFHEAIGAFLTVEAILSVHLMEENCDGCCR